MKSLNVKRIAAAVAGTMMMGAAFAGAAVNVDTAGVSSFPFFSAGEPNVKVVIGAKAQPIDVVVGANIAAVLGNLAYKTQAVSVLNTDKLGTAGDGSGTLTDKQVTLAVTTPGVNPATAYEMKAYIEDDLDNFTETTRGHNTGTAFQNVNVSFTTSGANAGPKVVSKDVTSILAPAPGMPADGKIAYPKGSTNTKEEQKVYVYAYVTYDSITKTVQTKNVKTGYEVIFTDPIPLCLDTSKLLSACTSDTDKLSKGHVGITFLGDVWQIFDYTATDTNVTSITLGKEITRKETFQIDEQVTTPDGFVIKLTDLSAFSPQRAAFDILNKDGNLVKRVYLGEGESSTIAEANNIVLKVNKVFPGAFAKQATSDVSMFSSQLVLADGQEITGGESHQYWKAKIQGWTTVGSSIAISKIQVYNDQNQLYKTPVTSSMNPGESINLIKGMPGYKLNYLGLETVDYDSLNFQIQKTQTLTNTSSSPVTGNFLYIQSGKTNAFQYSGRSNPDIYVLLESTQPWNVNSSVWYLDSNGNAVNAASNGAVVYNYKSDESATIYVNATYLNTTGGTAGTLNGALIAIPEISEDNNGTSATLANNYHLNLYYDAALDQFVNTIGSTTVDKIGYDFGKPAGVGPQSAFNLASQDKGFISNRGNIFTGISSTQASINYALKPARARFTLTGGSATASSNEAKVTLKEGDPYTVGGGYSLKVDSITAKIGGGAAGGVTGIDELKASVENAAVVTALDTAGNPLVVLDSEASDTANLVVVGGQIVNTVASAAGVSLKAGDQPIVQVFGSTKLVVAGYSAADTKEAGNALINWLNDNRDSVRG